MKKKNRASLDLSMVIAGVGAGVLAVGLVVVLLKPQVQKKQPSQAQLDGLTLDRARLAAGA